MAAAQKLNDDGLRREPLIEVPREASILTKTGEAPSTQPSRQPSRLQVTIVKGVDNASRTALILFAIGFVAFAGGVALASAILMDAIDHKSGWLKDVIDNAKQLARTAKNW